ncbi:MAG: hypothetical protein IJD00_04930 [Clostridia bacterium]|nr:hypothetical protein [Clostridia bacterium]
MKFFIRCKTLKNVLSVLEVILGIALGFGIYDIILDKPATFNQFIQEPSAFLFAFELILFIAILIAIISFSCIIKDAEEDLTAIMRLSEDKTDEKG